MTICDKCDKKEICALVEYSVAEKCHRQQGRVREIMVNLIHIENTRKKASVRQKNLSDNLWEKMHEQWDDDFRIENDSTLFTDSEEMNNMIQKYQNDLIKVLSGLEEKLPDWYGIEAEDEDEEEE